MAAPNQLWSSIAKDTNYTGGTRTFATETSQPKSNTPAENNTRKPSSPRRKRATSPSHIPKTTQKEPVYVLTLLTDKPHHERMTALRNKYFPPKINKLAAHLTLFHALPESKLESTVIPTIKRVTAEWEPFSVNAAKPFRMKKGIAISVPKTQGGDLAQKLHGALQEDWKGEGWLSEQDAGGMMAHYTIMNKVDDEGQVADTLNEVSESWKPDRGTVEGVALWKYERGYWKWEQAFKFGKKEDEKEQ
jgi:hypothetical protein